MKRNYATLNYKWFQVNVFSKSYFPTADVPVESLHDPVLPPVHAACHLLAK